MRQPRITSIAVASIMVWTLGLSSAVVVAQSPSAPSSVTGTWFDGLDAGICLQGAADGSGAFDFSVPAPVVPCVQEHAHEIVARVPLGEGAYPGGDVAAVVGEACEREYETFLGRPIEDTTLQRSEVWPDATDWAAGAHDGLCVAHVGEQVRGTAASGRLTAPGETLAVFHEVDGQADIWLVDAGTGELTRNITADDRTRLLNAPGWSPDGSLIAYSALVGDDDADIFTVPVAGGTPTELVSGPTSDDGPAFSPDASTVAYISKADSPEFEIYTRDLASGTVERLTSNDVRDASPQWSPDGSRIAFRRRSDGVSDIWVMGSDGSDAQRLTAESGNDFDPRWSPDGTQLLFTTDRSGDYDVWVMNADGSDQRSLTAHPADDEYPTWSRDGRFIAFHSARHDGTTLWLMRADGTETSLLTGVAPVGYPMFAPVPID